MKQESSAPDGWRERKRRETLQRIAETGLKLFVENGYEATTLEAIAAASGISARTFFYYFKSKEDILLAWQQGMPEAVRAAILAEAPDQRPVHLVRNAFLKLAVHFSSEHAVAIDRIVRSTEQLRASNQAKFLSMEKAVFEALSEHWPQARRRRALQVVAMACVGAMRLSVDAWADEGGQKPLASFIRQIFSALEDEL
ncbi:TetR family transcriptional regulator [Bradyrhizobium sp. CCBAU 53340]|uniref:TetR/AcrR family transcriptional regulator n=1 Tax=Bradyrhizobium sp. CCBAU 53340 TaxID=1325112 RepID=UPI00188A1675|nr:TetR/AcrR family transcriptional regulator [Bradyrhizobium sp. CCBAU 53340]QOZ44712.1 TetR family transcriptional regulator [Bradyrhizobium sp. CCBAU 53340]